LFLSQLKMASQWASMEFNEKVIVVRSNESVDMRQLRTWVKYVIYVFV
jgi:hypothetical protein